MRNLALVAMCLIPAAAAASEVLVGGSYARGCADQAAFAAEGAGPDDAIAVCNKAIADEGLTARDLAATFVNRGVLYLAAAAPAPAERDFRAAIAINATSGEAYVDLGAAEIAEQRFDPGIADIDKGLNLAAKEPAKAYFNRALAEDDKGDEPDAYRDYRMALQLKPGWAAPAQELTRFTVTTNGENK